MASVSVFNEKDTNKYKHTFKNEMSHLEYLLTEYVNREEKVKSKCFCGINCDDNPESAYDDFIAIKMAFNKYNPEDEKSREFKHYSIGFTPEESKLLGAETINKMCKEIIERVPEFKNYQVSIATHEDKAHIHSHIIVNSVNMIDGHKIQLPKNFLTKFQIICNEYTKEHGLLEHTLPNTKKLDDKKETYKRFDWNLHQKGEMSKTEEFARKIERIIKNTNNRFELFKAMKENNLTMSWREDTKYNDKLNIGKITIIDNATKEKHRLETLYKKYNIDIMSNKDLVEHFKLIDKINEIRNESLIKNIKIEKDDLIKVNNIEDLKMTYKEIKEKINKNKNLKYWQLDIDKKEKLRNYAKLLIDNSPKLKENINNKTEELLIKAKEINKELNYMTESKYIENQLKNIIAQKIYAEIKNDKQKETTNNTIEFLIKSLSNCMKNTSYNNINKLNDINKLKNDEKERLKDIEKAISY